MPAAVRRPRRRHRLQRRHAARRVREPRALHYLGFDPSDVSALRGREGLRRRQRLLLRRSACASATPTRKPRSSRASRCSTTSRIRAPSSREVRGAGRGRHLGVRAAYMPTMLETNASTRSCHEHLEYYSLAVIERLLGEAGLRGRRRRAQRHQRRLDPLFIGHAGAATSAAATARGADPALRDEGVRAGARLPRALRARSGAASERVTRRAARAVQAAARRGQEDPRLRRLDQGQHDPPVRGDRQHG